MGPICNTLDFHKLPSKQILCFIIFEWPLKTGFTVFHHDNPIPSWEVHSNSTWIPILVVLLLLICCWITSHCLWEFWIFLCYVMRFSLFRYALLCVHSSFEIILRVRERWLLWYYCLTDVLLLSILCGFSSRKYHNHTLQTNPRHREEQPQNIFSNNTYVRQ